MGYTHYWRRPRIIPKDQFHQVAEHFKELVPYLGEAGVRLAGWNGKGEAVLGDNEVCFNGLAKCGHADVDLGIAWPAQGARGVSTSATVPAQRAGSWFAGATLATRACGGDCSHETMDFPRVLKPEKWDRPEDDGRYFAFCKTAFKPYDLAVTAFLIVAKHHMGQALVVSSDGEMENWADAIRLCQHILGYGQDFTL